MSMGDAMDLLDYWREYPPVHLILRAVHKKENADRPAQAPPAAARGSRDEPEENEALGQLFEAQRIAGGALGPRREMPEHLKRMADYAEETISKMRLN